MKEFTGYQYLLIDIANQWGLDKLRFEERIDWTEQNLNQLEKLACDRGPWKERPLYLKAVSALRRAQRGEDIGHMVGLDAVCSGMQIMSALTGCVSGADATGLVDPDRRADAYTTVSSVMSTHLAKRVENLRRSVKNAVMTCLYGSKKEPEKEFGKGSPELEAFYKALQEVAPGACTLLMVLLESWQPWALSHQWRLPDGHQAFCPTTEVVEARIKVAELNNSSFTFNYTEVEGVEHSVANAANVIHSIDAYLLRSLIRRCNYDYDAVVWCYNNLQSELIGRGYEHVEGTEKFLDASLAELVGIWKETNLVDARMFQYLHAEDLSAIPTELARQLVKLGASMLDHKPFPVVTVHDEFKCHPNNVNAMRKHYRDIMADMAESKLLDWVLTQLYGEECTFERLSSDLPSKIRQSAYGIC